MGIVGEVNSTLHVSEIELRRTCEVAWRVRDEARWRLPRPETPTMGNYSRKVPSASTEQKTYVSDICSAQWARPSSSTQCRPASYIGGATLDVEENYVIKKLFTALGIIQIENQARI